MSLNLRKIKINNLKTVKMLTALKVKHFKINNINTVNKYADNSKFIPQVHKGMPYRNLSPDQVMGF